MADEAPEHVWYRGRQFEDGTYSLICVTNFYHWGAVSAEVAENFAPWTEELYLASLDIINPAEADNVRAAHEAGEEISWQLP
jgi:hypothetical protein